MVAWSNGCRRILLLRAVLGAASGQAKEGRFNWPGESCVRPLNVVGSLTAIFESKRIDRRSQRRLLPLTRVTEEEAGEGRAPIFEDPDQRPACEVRRSVILHREREADTASRRAHIQLQPHQARQLDMTTPGAAIPHIVESDVVPARQRGRTS